MNQKSLLCILLLGTLTSCFGKKESKEEVVSRRYLHNRGYDVSKEDWDSNQYPGRILTTLRNGSTLTESFEEGLLHGSRTLTHPHSQTIQTAEVYHHGQLKKKTIYSIRGVPEIETEFLGPEKTRVTRWYFSGSPRSVEEIEANQLKQASYYNSLYEIESQVIEGCGERILRDPFGLLLSKERLVDSSVVHIETFHSNGTPKRVASYLEGKLHGICQEFAFSGEPLSIEEWDHGILDGTIIHFQNGNKYEEIPYVKGLRQGTVRRYVDGSTLVEETEWSEGKKHGSSVLFIDGAAKTSWFFQDLKVSKNRFEELNDRLQYVAMIDKEFGDIS